MRKYAYITAFFISAVMFLSGCSWFSTNTNQNQNINQIVNENQNTNQVTVINENENVNTEINENENINVATNQNNNINESLEVDISDWLTYTNEEYRYMVKYPEDELINGVPFHVQNINNSPTEHTDENPFTPLKQDLLDEKNEIESAELDNTYYILINNIKIKRSIHTTEGMFLIDYIWYDDENKYNIAFTFPSSNEEFSDINNKYPTNNEKELFFTELLKGTADAKYQEQVNLCDNIISTLSKY